MFPNNFEPTITPRENYLRTLRHQNPQWIPMKSDSINFSPRIYPDNVARAFVIDGQPYDGPVGGPDIFGIQWKYIPVAGGSMVEPGKALSGRYFSVEGKSSVSGYRSVGLGKKRGGKQRISEHRQAGNDMDFQRHVRAPDFLPGFLKPPPWP